MGHISACRGGGHAAATCAEVTPRPPVVFGCVRTVGRRWDVTNVCVVVSLPQAADGLWLNPEVCDEAFADSVPPGWRSVKQQYEQNLRGPWDLS